MSYLLFDSTIFYLVVAYLVAGVIGWNMGKLPAYILNILISLDQLANTLLGGDPDHTISGRMGRAIVEGRCRFCRPICKFLNVVFRQKNHCKQSIEWDRGSRAIWKWGKK